MPVPVVLLVVVASAGGVGLLVQVRARRRLHLIETRFASILGASGFGVLLLDEHGIIEYVNHAGADILLRPRTEIMGQHFHQMLHEDAGLDESGSICALQAATQGDQPYRAEERFAGGHGGQIPVMMTCLPVAPDHRRAVIAFLDRSADLAQARQREEVFALVSHEIRSPLTTVVGYSARLRAAVASGALKVDEHRAEEVVLLAREAERMREIILLILGTAEIERGRIEFEVEPIRMRQLVQDEIGRVQLHRPTATFALHAEDVVVESDERYVRLILQNLLENAAKYGGGIQVEVALSATEDGCRLTIRDHGDGIPLEAQPRIFERFYRHPSAATHGRGLGLGLYFSRTVAHRLGGDLTFTSTPGEGATFQVILPTVCPAEASDPAR